MRNINALPAANTWGPKMQALSTDLQRQFIVVAAQNPHLTHARMAEMAGYGGPNKSMESLAVTAHHLMHDEKILAAIDEYGKQCWRGGQLLAMKTLMDQMQSGDAKLAQGAAKFLLESTGTYRMTEMKVTHDYGIDDPAMIRRLFSLAKELNLNPRELLGNKGVVISPEMEKVIDAEFTEISANAETQPSSEGLEDVL